MDDPGLVAERSAREYYRQVDRSDIDAVLALFSDAVVYHRPGYPTVRGQAELRDFYCDHRIIERGRHTVDTILIDYPHVAVNGHFTGALRTGKTVSLRFADFFEVGPDGRFVRRDTFFFTPLV